MLPTDDVEALVIRDLLRGARELGAQESAVLDAIEQHDEATMDNGRANAVAIATLTGLHPQQVRRALARVRSYLEGDGG